jgi:hypothetical protein
MPPLPDAVFHWKYEIEQRREYALWTLCVVDSIPSLALVLQLTFLDASLDVLSVLDGCDGYLLHVFLCGGIEILVADIVESNHSTYA